MAKRTLLPVGPAYLAHVRRSIHNHSFEEHDKLAEEERKKKEHANGENVEDDLGVGDEEETEDILSLDPKEWKVGLSSFRFGETLTENLGLQKQDHYAVLGLSSLRYKATQDQIKIARTYN